LKSPSGKTNRFELVPHSIELVFLVFFALVDTGSGALALNPVVARRHKVTVLHSPDFLADALGELSGVRTVCSREGISIFVDVISKSVVAKSDVRRDEKSGKLT
jgi:hypothetical protein